MVATPTKTSRTRRRAGTQEPLGFQIPIIRTNASGPITAKTSPGTRRIGQCKPSPVPQRSLKPSQIAAYNRLAGQDYVILNSPTGWGKSTVLVFLATSRLLADPQAKVVFIVPQKVVKKGFIGPIDLRLPTGGISRWEAGLDLCDQTEAKVRSLARFIADPPSGDIPGRVAVATHATFVAAYDRLDDPARAFAGTTCVIDEGHHVRSDPEGRNRLGHAVNALIDNGVPVWLATAFFFRGDSAPILTEGHLPLFARHHVPFDRYFGELEHIKSYTYDFVIYRESVFAEVEGLLKVSKEPILIYCPPAGSPVLGGQTKQHHCGRLVALIKKHYPGSSLWEPGTRSKRVILDLADVGDRAEKLAFLLEHGDRVAAVLTVGMLKEGADWVQAARVIDLVPSGSDQERGQKFGRLMRDCPGKSQVAYYNFLPGVLTKSEEEQRLACSKLFGHFHVRLVMENALRPVQVRLRQPLRGEPGGEGGAAGEVADLLGLFSEPKQREIHEAVTSALVGLSADREEEGQVVGWQEASEAILDVLIQQGCGQVVGDANLPALRDQIGLLWKRRKSPDADLAELIGSDWDKVWASDLLEPLRIFTAGACGVETFEELRTVLGNRGQMAAEAWAREFVLRYAPGRIPSQRSGDRRERADAQKLSEVRMARRGVGRHQYYPSVDAILADGGHAGILETTDHQADAESWARGVVARHRPGSLPSLASPDPFERSDAKKIARLRAAKAGKAGRAAFYPSVEAIFEAAGYSGVFDPNDPRNEAEAWARDCAARYRPGSLPRYDTTDPRERSDLAKIRNYRNAKRGTGKSAYYPSLEAIFEAAGHPGVFDVENRRRRAPGS